MRTFSSAVFEDALCDLRVQGSVLRCERYRAPWSIAIPDEAGLRAALAFGPEARVIPFHFVREGGVDLELGGDHFRQVPARSVAILPGGQAHRMTRGGGEAHPLDEALLHRPPFAVPEGAAPMEGDTDLVCGVFVLRAGGWNPLLAALPSVLTVDVDRDGAEGQAALAARMLEAEASSRPGGFVTARLVEIFFAEAIRSWGAQAEATGWFAALRDERIGRALSAFHAAPAEPWTVASLASRAALSPSRFAARFREVMGMAAMRYVANWRMSLACRRMIETDEPLAAIARAVGYADPAAFSRAFKAATGESPARWRSARRTRHQVESK